MAIMEIWTLGHGSCGLYCKRFEVWKFLRDMSWKLSEMWNINGIKIQKVCYVHAVRSWGNCKPFFQIKILTLDGYCLACRKAHVPVVFYHFMTLTLFYENACCQCFYSKNMRWTLGPFFHIRDTKTFNCLNEGCFWRPLLMFNPWR